MWNCWKLFQRTVLESDYLKSDFIWKILQCNFTELLSWVNAPQGIIGSYTNSSLFLTLKWFILSLSALFTTITNGFFFRTQVLIKDNSSVKLAINLECGYATTKKIFKTGLLLSQWWLKKHFCLHLQSHSTWLGRQIFNVPSLTRSRFNKRPIYYLSTGLN